MKWDSTILDISNLVGQHRSIAAAFAHPLRDQLIQPGVFNLNLLVTTSPTEQATAHSAIARPLESELLEGSRARHTMLAARAGYLPQVFLLVHVHCFPGEGSILSRFNRRSYASAYRSS